MEVPAAIGEKLRIILVTEVLLAPPPPAGYGANPPTTLPKEGKILVYPPTAAAVICD